MLTLGQLHQFKSWKNLQMIIWPVRTVHILWVSNLAVIEIMSSISDTNKPVNVSLILLFIFWLIMIVMISIRWLSKFKLIIVDFSWLFFDFVRTKTRLIFDPVKVLSYYLIFRWSVTHGVLHLVRDLFVILFCEISQLSLLCSADAILVFIRSSRSHGLSIRCTLQLLHMITLLIIMRHCNCLMFFLFVPHSVKGK